MSVAVLLAVDDRPDNLFVLEQVVGAYLPEIKMITAESAEAGLALAATEAIEGALIDVQMPGMNGIEMCRRLKADPRTALIHVILVTAHRATPELKAQGLEAGADDFIAKPIDNVELAAKLRVMLRLRAAEQALRRERDHLEATVQERTQALRDAEYRYRTLFHAASDAMFINDIEGRLLEVNEEACRRLGYTREELLHLKVRDVTSPEYVARRPEILEQLQAKGSFVFENDLVTRDGRIIPTETSSRLMELQGRPAVLSIARDITERKEAEKSLRQSEERFRLVFEKAPIGIMHYDQTGTVIDCNEKFAGVIGAPKETFIGFNMIRQLHDEQMRKAVAASLDGQVGYYEGDYLSVSGEKSTPVRAIAQPILSPEGVSSGGITIFEDITERQRAVSELKLKEKLLDSASDSIFLHDLEGNFLYMNEAAYTTRWYTKEELLSLGAWALTTPEAAVNQDDILRELWANGELIFESEHRRKDGSVIPVEIFARVLVVEDREMILSIARDITERQRAAEELKESLARVTEVQDGTIEALVTVTEARDPYTAGHQRRVTQLACAVARELGLPADRVAGLRVMGLLHDLGKISIPAEILSKPGKLSATEFGFIKSHAQAGYEIIKEIQFPWPVAEVILQHHERMDGSGYPQGLTGPDITLEARILAVADVVEAMSSHRPYRAALGLDQALEEIAQKKGVLYDPEVADACIKVCTGDNFTFD